MKQENASKVVAGVAIVIFMCVIYALVIEQVLDNDQFANIDVSGTITNETLSALDNITNATLAAKSTYSGASCTLTSLNNATDGDELTSGNYTFYSSACNIILTDTSAYIGEDVNATYGYTYESNGTLSGVNVTSLKSDFGGFITAILSFIVIMGTILGILWFFKYVRPLLSRKEGIQGMTA